MFPVENVPTQNSIQIFFMGPNPNRPPFRKVSFRAIGELLRFFSGSVNNGGPTVGDFLDNTCQPRFLFTGLKVKVWKVALT